MLLLTSTADLLQLVTSAAQALEVHASWVDNASGTITPGRTNTEIPTATTTPVVGSPGASTQRNVQTLLVRNNGAAVNDVTVRHTDGTTPVDIFKATLAAGECLMFLDGLGFRVVEASGSVKQGTATTGRYLRCTVLTSGTSFSTGTETRTIKLRMVGGGGGGGGCTSLAAAAAAAGGGGAGAYAEKSFAVTPNTAYTYAIGAAGAGASGAVGGNGGNTTFAVGATTVTAPGGTGGPVATAATTLTARGGGPGGAIATNGDVNAGGAPGEYGVVLIIATPIVASGNGGGSQFGAGGLGLVAVGNGSNAVGPGAGGGGSATGAAAVRTGGNGGAGLIFVDEYA